MFGFADGLTSCRRFDNRPARDQADSDNMAVPTQCVLAHVCINCGAWHRVRLLGRTVMTAGIILAVIDIAVSSLVYISNSTRSRNDKAQGEG